MRISGTTVYSVGCTNFSCRTRLHCCCTYSAKREAAAIAAAVAAASEVPKNAAPSVPEYPSDSLGDGTPPADGEGPAPPADGEVSAPLPLVVVVFEADGE